MSPLLAARAEGIIGLQAGENRRQLDVTAPFALSDDRLFWGQAGFSRDDDGTDSLHFGIGMRQQMQAGILGFGLFVDRSEVKQGDAFRQLSLGAEWLTDRFEARANLYHPIGTRTVATTGTGAVTANASGISYRGAALFAQRGFDAEIGTGFDLGQMGRAGLFAGGFRFDLPDGGHENGTRLRAEWRLTDPSHGIWQAHVGAQAERSGGQTDSKVYAGLRVAFGRSGTPRKDNLLDRPFLRQNGVRLARGAFGKREAVRFGDVTLAGYHNVAAGGDLAGTVTKAGERALIFATGAHGLKGTVALQNGQVVVGGQGAVTLTSADSGARITMRNDGDALNITGAAGQDAVAMASNSTFAKARVTGGANGIVARGVDHATLHDVILTGQSAAGVSISNSKTLTAGKLQISGSGGDGIEVQNSNGFTLTESAITTPTRNGLRFDNVDGVQVSRLKVQDLPICENNTTCEFSIFKPTIAPNAAISAVALSNARFDDLDIRNTTYGIFMAAQFDDSTGQATIAKPGHDVSITNTRITDSRREGILAVGIDKLQMKGVSIDNSGEGANMDLMVLQSTGKVQLSDITLKGGVNGLMLVNYYRPKGMDFSVAADNLKISKTSRAGIFANPVKDVTISDSTITDAGTYGAYIYGDGFGFLGGPVRNFRLENVTVSNAKTSGLYFSGPSEDVTGKVKVDGSPACAFDPSPWSGGKLTQPAGGQLQVNGKAIATAADCGKG